MSCGALLVHFVCPFLTWRTSANAVMDRRYGTILAPVTGATTGKRFHQFNLLGENGESLQPTLYVRCIETPACQHGGADFDWRLMAWLRSISTAIITMNLPREVLPLLGLRTNLNERRGKITAWPRNRNLRTTPTTALA